ncbi:unnamed protein product [Dibothriocephalus latus]|uniref:Uncharacterized protein n=1 Tax=Dibothriocephalus latus TaxID=60516 RepID=A0A3P6NX55_DIBLA|nr:unnamed protein product [Dibothriocephalus latus]
MNVYRVNISRLKPVKQQARGSMVRALDSGRKGCELKSPLDALKEDPRVCSNYSPEYMLKTLRAFENFKTGTAVFTFPKPPIKCAGAPLKAIHVQHRYYLRMQFTIYNPALPQTLLTYTALTYAANDYYALCLRTFSLPDTSHLSHSAVADDCTAEIRYTQITSSTTRPRTQETPVHFPKPHYVIMHHAKNQKTYPCI